ncbi:MAG: phage major capsid protein [Agriterribacter sp.]
MADEKVNVAERLDNIAATAQKGINDAETRLEKKADEKIASAKEEATKAATKAAMEAAVKEAQTIIDNIKAEHAETVKSLKDDIKELKQQNGTLMVQARSNETIGDAVMRTLMSDESKEKIKGLRSAQGNTMLKFDIELSRDMITKAVHTMVRGTDITGDNTLLTDLQPGTVRILRRRPFIRSIVSVGRTNNGTIKYVEHTNPEGGAGMTAEGNPKSQASFQYVTREITAKKITAYIKVSDEFLDDIEEAESDIRQELIDLIELKLDEQLLTGDGNTNNIKGIDAWSTPWAHGTFLDTIVDPNEADVVRAGIAQQSKMFLMSTHVLMNPVDAAKLDMAKGSDGHYQKPGFMTGNNIDGVQIVENPGVTEGTAYLIDSAKLKLKIRKDLAITVGRDGNDLTNNLITFIAEMRAAMYLPVNHTGAVLKINLTTAKKNLDEASS